MKRDDGVAFVQSTAARGSAPANPESLWESAKFAVDERELPNLFPRVGDLSADLAARVEAVKACPQFQLLEGRERLKFKMVELGRLVSYQKFVDPSHAEAISAGHNLREMESLFDLCLPTSLPARTFTLIEEPPRGITMYASGQDHRSYGPKKQKDEATGRWHIGFSVGWGPPFFQVIKFRGRYLLKNGYHRAYALRRAGITSAPALLLETSNPSEVGALRPGFFEADLLGSDKPPTIDDFLSDSICVEYPSKTPTKVIRMVADESTIWTD